jgi:tRNA-modifying protein YgfZ
MPAWAVFLAERNAVFEQDTVVSFGDPTAELAAARDQAIICDLSSSGVLRVAGADAAAFLQGQLSNDVEALAPGTCQLAAWCSAKGRVLAVFVVRRIDVDTFELLLPGSLLAAMQKRLTMFVLRAKVGIEDVSAATLRLGIGGPSAMDVVSTALGRAPASPGVAVVAGAAVAGLRGARYIAYVEPEAAIMLWDRIAAVARPSGLAAWRWLVVRNGIPVITPPTSDQFLPQALNLDALEGISFRKGCYAGQEIVARTQYLGRLKERLVLAHVSGMAPTPGDRLYSPAFDARPCGTIIDAAAAPGGGSDLLAVLQVAARDSGTVHADAPGGRALAWLPLPYALPVAAPPRGRIA